MRLFLKLFFLLFFVLPLALAGLLYLAVDTEPSINRAAEITPSNIERAKRILDQNDPRKLDPGARRDLCARARGEVLPGGGRFAGSAGSALFMCKPIQRMGAITRSSWLAYNVCRTSVVRAARAHPMRAHVRGLRRCASAKSPYHRGSRTG